MKIRSDADTGSSFGQRLALIAFGLAATVLVLVLVESGLALFGIGDDLLYEDPFVGFVPGQDVFERVESDSGTAIYTTTPAKLAFFNHQQFPADKSSDTFRIFTVGGSTTAGRPYDDQVSFSSWLRIYLPAVDPGRRWEVINAGAISYASYRVVVLMKELVRYAPDLIVVYTGHNEFLEERTYSQIKQQNAAVKKLRLWLNGLRSYSLARHYWLNLTTDRDERQAGLEPEVTAKLDDWTGLQRFERDEPLRDSIIEHFEYNLRQIVAIARGHDIEVIFVKPISNLKDFSPFKSQPTAATSAAEIAERESLLAEARALLRDNDVSGALAGLKRAVEIDPEFAESYFRLGEAHLAAGNLAAAREAFVKAKELDVAPLRALEPIVEAVSRVADELAVPLVDLPAIIDTPIPGNEHLIDHVHPDIPVHSQIAEALVGVLIDEGVARPHPTWSAEKQNQLYEQHLATLDRSYYAERDLNLAKVLGWAGKIKEAELPLRRAVEVLPDNPEVHLNLGIVLEKQEIWAEAASELQRAVELQPSLAEGHFNLGVVHGALDDLDAAITSLQRATELRPDYAEAWFNLGVLQRRAGHLDASLASLLSAQALESDAVEIHTQLGLTLQSLERWTEAQAAFEESLELDPDNARARTGLGGVLAELGNRDAALREMLQAVQLDPSDPQALFDLARIHQQNGQRDEAIDAYRRATALAPGFAEAYNNLGILLAESGDIEGASRAFLAAIQGAPEDAEGYFNLGVLYDGVGRGDDALRAIGQAVDLAPDVAHFRLALGMLLRARGQDAAALDHLRRAQLAGAVIPPEVERWMAAQ